MSQPIRIRFRDNKNEVLEFIKKNGQLEACDKYGVTLIPLQNWLARKDVVGDANFGGVGSDYKSMPWSDWALRQAYLSAHEYRIKLLKRKRRLEREIEEAEHDCKKWEQMIVNLELVEVTE